MKKMLFSVKLMDFYVVKSYQQPYHFGSVRSLVSLACATFFSVMPATAQAQTSATDHFVLKITTTAGTNPEDKAFTFYTQDTNYDIDWDNDQTFDATRVSGNQSHVFATPGVKTIRFRNLNDVYANNQRGREKYTSIEQWGTSVWNADMSYAFLGTVNMIMNPSAGTPDMSAVTNMKGMFRVSFVFNGDIGGWNTSAVTNMKWMFSGARSFNQDIGGWNTASVTNMHAMFEVADSFNQDIGNWNTAQVTDMSAMFSQTTSFNQDISGWNTASVTAMFFMFAEANSFSQDIGGWNIESVTDMSYMFALSSSFNSDIGGWNTASVTDMSFVFLGARSFNQDISGWNTSTVTTMKEMFSGASSFNQDIGNWNTAKVTDMYAMFYAGSFNQDIGNWNTASVTKMSDMFARATSFNQDIGNWNTEQVTDMSFVFDGATSFNGDIGNWNTAKVTTMWNMFFDASSFNQDIGNWNTASLTDMYSMFYGATSFDQNVGNWNVEAVTEMEDIFFQATLSIENYDALLVGWNAQNLRPNVVFHGGNSLFRSSEAQTARENIISSAGHLWTITDGGRETMNQAPTNISLSSIRVAENAGPNAVVGILSNTDSGGTYEYTLVAGTGDLDNASFNILGTNLRLTASADYETKITYSVRIKVSDGTNDFEKSFTIFLINELDSPPVFISLANVNVEEGTTEVIDIVPESGERFGAARVLTTLSGADGSKFLLTPHPARGTATLRFKETPDFENPRSATGSNVYKVIVTAEDNLGLTAEQEITVTVTDVEENDYAPVFSSGTTFSVVENTRIVATVTATDGDTGQNVSFMLTGGADQSNFSITPTGVLLFDLAPDFEGPRDVGTDNMYEVTITATDNGTPAMTAVQTLTITVTDDPNETPPLGLEAFTGIAVYPNPVDEVLHISGAEGNARYTLSGMEGKILKRGKLRADKSDHSVAIPSLKKGIYLLQITTGEGNVTKKIVKE